MQYAGVLLVTRRIRFRRIAPVGIAHLPLGGRGASRVRTAYYCPASSDLSAEDAERGRGRLGSHFGVEFGTVYRPPSCEIG